MKTYRLLGAATLGQIRSQLPLILAGLCVAALLFAPGSARAGLVTTTADSGPGSLRDVLNAEPNNGTVTFAGNLSGQTILLGGQIFLNRNVTIDASALANGIAIDGNAASRIFRVNGFGLKIVLNSLTITNGYASDYGGGILDFGGGPLTLTNCKLVNNQSGASPGGAALYHGSGSLNGGFLTMIRTTVSGNTGSNSAVFVESSQVTITDCTFSGNSVGAGSALRMERSANSVTGSTFSGNVSGAGPGAAISVWATSGTASANLVNCTVVSNVVVSAGQPGAIYFTPDFGDATVSLYNSIVSGNTSGGVASDISGNVQPNSAYNLIGVGGGLTHGVNNNQVGITNPLVAPLGNYGGRTQTMPPLLGSPAINRGGSSVWSMDQRGFPRPVGQADIGAVELQPTVTTTADSGPGSLRDAVAVVPSSGTITFTTNLSGQTITLTSGQLVVSNNVTIDASTLTNGLAINGNANSRIFQINSGAGVTLNSLTLSNGNAQAGFGGAIVNLGTLTVNNCTLAGNTGAVGGAVSNNAVCTLQNSTLYGNNATTGNGGAIANASGATLNLLQSTLSGNNTPGNGGGIYNSLGQINVTNTIVAGNTGGDIYNASGSTLTCGGSNIVQVLGNSGTVLGGSTILEMNPLLGPLANHGGSTWTLVPQSGSPAVNAGVSSAAASLTADQRGFPRLSGSTVDIGAVEFQYPSVVTLFASGMTTNAATLNGRLDPSDGTNTVYFEYGTTTNYGSVTTGINLGDSNSAAPFSTLVTSLSPGTIYHFRAVAITTAGLRYGADSSFGTAITRVFTGAEPGQGLDLQGSFLYAVNLGSNGAPGLIGDANFTADTVPGVTISSLGTSDNWANPNFGATTNGLRLKQVMSSMRWTAAPAIFTVNLSGLQVGANYRLQLLFIERDSDRVFDVFVNGAIIASNFRLLDYGSVGTPIVMRCDFTAASTNALIQISGGVGGTDHNPQMSGFTLERLANIVSNTNDAGSGSLRDTVMSMPPGGSITFAPNLSGQTITLTSGQLVLSNNVTIDGSELTNGVAINGNANSRIFQVNSGASVVLNSLTLTNGNAAGGSGGAIANLGTLTVNNCTLAANIGGFGGAIINNGLCTVQNCTLVGNGVTVGNGGAMVNAASATLNLLQCTVSGNGTVGIDNSQGQVNVTNTIIAGNTGGDISNGSGSTLTLGGSNIVQVLGNAGTVLGGSSILAVNPLLGPLTNNGGRTLTLLPQIGSPAINAGVSSAAASLTTDQRGLPRLSGSAVDIGAVEFQIPVLTLPATGVVGNAATLNGTVNPGGLATTVYFQYGLTTSYGNVTPGINFSGSNSVPFSTLITSLAQGTTYHFRAASSNAVGLMYGADFSFTTGLSHSFTGAEPGMGLDLQGAFVYAVNVGNNGAPGLIGDANFTADNVSGVTITTPGGVLNTIDNWANPNFGATLNGLRLKQVMSSMRWTGAPGIFTVNLSGLQVGASYKLQLLHIESGFDRVFNVIVNSNIIASNFRLWDYGPSGTPIVTTYIFTSASTNALIQLGGGVGGTDHNPTMSGLTLERLPIEVTNTNDAGDGSLRNAVVSTVPGDTITFATNLSGQTITLTSGQLVLSNNNVIIDASMLANGITINGNANSRIFQVNSGAGVTLNSLTLINGNASGSSGGAIANFGNLVVSNCTLAANTGAAGGAIGNNAVCTLQNSTFYGNGATAGNGGAIVNASSAVLNLLHCTFSGNSTVGNGGGIYNLLSQVNVTNTIVAGNTGGDIYNPSGSTLTFGGSNIVQVLGNAGTVLGGSTILAANPLLGSLTNNGGRTLTLVPQSGSPAINAGVNSAAVSLTTDQRGFPRLAGSAVDIGAVEFRFPSVTTLSATGVTANAATLKGNLNPGDGTTTVYFEYGFATNYGSVTAGIILSSNSVVPFSTAVTSLSSGTTYHFRAASTNAEGMTYGADSSFSTEIIFSLTNVVSNLNDAGNGSLRQAAVSTLPGGLVTFATNLSGQTITLTSGEIFLENTNLIIDASALTNGISINGNATSRIFYVDEDANVLLNALTLTNGNDIDDAWAGAIVNRGNLALNNCTIAGNSSGYCGGIYNDGQLTLSGCTLSANTGVYIGVLENEADCTLQNCTFYGNAASDESGFSGAIYNDGNLNILHCTFSGNNSSEYRGAILNYDQVNMTNTIVAGNSGRDIYNAYSSTFTFGGSNIVQTLEIHPDGTALGTNTILAVNPLLGPLTNNGGRTLTLLPLNASPAIDAGVSSTAWSLTTDQRGLPRVPGSVDIGAVEIQFPVVTLQASGVTFNAATLNGAVNSGASTTWAYFRYGLTTNYGSFTSTNILPATNVTLLVSKVISNLTSGSTYYYQLVGSNSAGIAFGSQKTFTTTTPLPPTVTTLPASINTPTSATLNGTVHPHELTTIAYFQYGLTTNYGSFTGTTSLPGANTTLSVSNLISGLVPSATYHFRLVASNALDTVFGLDQIFGGTSPRVFTGAAPGQGLDLQGSFLYAVDIGNATPAGLIGDANFTADNVSGVNITTPGGGLHDVNNWASPDFGATTDGLRLTQVISSIRWTDAPIIFTINLSGLQVGRTYQLQLLFIESLSDRVFNVTVNGTTIVPNFRFLDYGPSGTPIVIPYVFVAENANALIQLGGGSGGNDNNPQISGFTLETLVPVTPPAPSVISSVRQAGTNLISVVTNGEPGSGWTWLTTTNLTPPVTWSTNRTGTFDGQGNVILTNAILSTESARYFILRVP